MQGPAKDFEDYLAAVPEPARTTLETLRRTIRAAVPEPPRPSAIGCPRLSTEGNR